MKVIHVSASDLRGGASRAAYGIHRSLCEHGELNNVISRMRVIEKQSDDPSVIGGDNASPLYKYIRPRLSVRNRFGRQFRTNNSVHHSFGWPDSGLGKELNQLQYDLIHLHWVGYLNGIDTLSIAEISKLNKPIIWTLHDQWAFCGGEHYTSLPPIRDKRYREGYSGSNRPEGESGVDRNRNVWLRKIRLWKRPMTIVCPSSWLTRCAKESQLMHNWPIHTIPYAIDTDKWSAINKGYARKMLGLPADKLLVMLCAVVGDPRKGADLLLEAMHHLYETNPTVGEATELVIVGDADKDFFRCSSFVHVVGRVSNDDDLRLYYSAVDVIVIPSRQENLSFTGLEGHSCGTPVVSFRGGGPEDIISHHITGALAEPFQPASLANEIGWILEDGARRERLGKAARDKAEKLWSQSVVAQHYCELYKMTALAQTVIT